MIIHSIRFLRFLYDCVIAFNSYSIVKYLHNLNLIILNITILDLFIKIVIVQLIIMITIAILNIFGITYSLIKEFNYSNFILIIIKVLCLLLLLNTFYVKCNDLKISQIIFYIFLYCIISLLIKYSIFIGRILISKFNIFTVLFSSNLFSSAAVTVKDTDKDQETKEDSDLESLDSLSGPSNNSKDKGVNHSNEGDDMSKQTFSSENQSVASEESSGESIVSQLKEKIREHSSVTVNSTGSNGSDNATVNNIGVIVNTDEIVKNVTEAATTIASSALGSAAIQATGNLGVAAAVGGAYTTTFVGLSSHPPVTRIVVSTGAGAGVGAFVVALNASAAVISKVISERNKPEVSEEFRKGFLKYREELEKASRSDSSGSVEFKSTQISNIAGESFTNKESEGLSSIALNHTTDGEDNNLDSRDSRSSTPSSNTTDGEDNTSNYSGNYSPTPDQTTESDISDVGSTSPTPSAFRGFLDSPNEDLFSNPVEIIFYSIWVIQFISLITIIVLLITFVSKIL
jgi:hypothetical protein